MPKTCVLILLDGLGDRSHRELNNMTPLQAAETPCLDKLASMGGTGLYHADKVGRPLPSENAHFAIFGSPQNEFPGRGYLEALGAKAEMEDCDIAVLAHFSSVLETMDRQLTVKYDRICGTAEELDALYAAASPYETDGIHFELHRTDGLFSVLTMRGDVSPHITDSNPMVNGHFLSQIRPLDAYKDNPSTIRTAQALTKYIQWAYEQLCEVPQNKLRTKQKLPQINGIVTQRAGQVVPHTSLRDRYGLNGLSVASGFMYKGMAEYLGMDFQLIKDTRDPGRDLAARLAVAHDSLETHNFIHIHTKAPDKAGHTKNPRAKVKAIESLDRGLAESIDPLLNNDDILLVITGDHSTPSAGPLIHSGEQVPVMFIGDGVRRDAVEKYDEISVASGCLGTLRKDEMMHMIMNYLDRARLRGIRDVPMKQEFWPGDYDPFTLVKN